MLKGFPVVVQGTPKILILGSMPSVVSLDKVEYYGFQHNRFWKIITEYFKTSFSSYEEKLNCLMKHQIALWDVIAMCEREGSLDSHIRNVSVNPIDQFLAEYPSVAIVFCNGKKSYQLYQKYFSSIAIPCICLPSTSNANRTIKEADLFALWIQAFDNYLKQSTF